MGKVRDIWNKIQSSDIGHRMATGAFWSFTGTVLAKLSVAIAGMVCARILGRELFGQYGMVKQTLVMLMLFGGGGLGLTATKYISEFRKSRPERVASIYMVSNGFALLMGIFLCFCLYFFSDYVATEYLNEAKLGFPLRVASAMLFFVVVNIAQEGVLNGYENFKAKAINTFSGNVVQAIMMIVASYYYGLIGAIIGYGMGYFVVAALNGITIRKQLRNDNVKLSLNNIQWGDLKLLLTYSLPATLSTLLAGPAYWIIRIILAKAEGYQGGALADYEVADQWRILILFVPNAVVQILLPILSSIGGDNQNKYWKVLKINLSLNVGVAMVMSLAVCALSFVILSLYGPQYTDKLPFIIMALSAILTALSSVLGTAISSQAKMWQWFFFNVIWALVAVALTYVFVIQLKMGATGCALAIFISFVEHSLVQYLYLKSVVKTS